MDDGASSVICQYCGTSSRVQGRSRILQVPRPLPPEQGAPRPVARQRVNRAAIFLPIALTLGMTAFGALMAFRAVGKVSIPGIPALPGAAARPDTWSASPPIVVDVDGDGVDDLVGLTRNVLDGDRAQLAAHSGRDGALLWKTARLGTYADTTQALVFAAGGLVVLATASGELQAFDATRGAPRWTSTLGERVRRACSDGEAGAVTVQTADERWHRIALADGARDDRVAPDVIDRRARRAALQPPAWVAAELPPGTCLPVPINEREHMPGLATADSWSKLPRIDGMNLERVVRRGTGPIVAIGGKHPGTAVPMLAVLDGTQARWKAVVPASDPLGARADDQHVTVSETAVFAVYESKGGPRITGFALEDGRRLWDQPLQHEHHLVLTGVMMTGDRVVVSAWGNLQAFDAATGAPAFLVGAL